MPNRNDDELNNIKNRVDAICYSLPSLFLLEIVDSFYKAKLRLDNPFTTTEDVADEWYSELLKQH